MSATNPNIWRSAGLAAGMLALFAIIGVGLVALTHDGTAERIASNERAALLETVEQILPRERYDNALFDDYLMAADPLLGSADRAEPLYRVRKQGKPVGIIVTAIAPNGYNGSIKVLVGIAADGELMGARVLSHKETPGLGDAIEHQRSDWIHAFTGRSLENPQRDRWAVRKDGGEFDQFTGATITPRAVVGAIHNALLYYEQERTRIFELPSATAAATKQDKKPDTANTGNGESTSGDPR